LDLVYKLAWPRTKKNGPAFFTRLLTPRSRKSGHGHGLLLGCRSPLDAGREKTTFFYAFPPQKTVESSFDGRARHRNRSGVVELQLVGREPLIIARVENGVKKFSPQRQKTPPKFSKRKLDQENSFQWEIFIFLAAGKLTFLGGV